MRGVLDLQSLAPGMQDAIASAIGSIPEVEAVFTARENRLVQVWTVISDATREVKRKVYGKEKEVIDSNEPFEFAFTVIPSRGRDPRSFMAEDMQLSYLRGR